jgi:hypothetical protein
MDYLSQSKLFRLFSDTSLEATNEEMQHAYGKFIAHIDTISQVGNDYTTIIRKLNITRIELVSLLKLFQYEQEKNAHKLRHIDKALSYVDFELSLIHRRIEHPEHLQQSEQPTFESELYIIPKSRDLGIIALAEIVVALFFSKKKNVDFRRINARYFTYYKKITNAIF